MDRVRSAYLIEGPDGGFLCGVRVSSFVQPCQSTTLEVPARLPGQLLMFCNFLLNSM